MNKRWTVAGSEILVYDNMEWVVYIDDAIKLDRTALYDSYNFARITD